MSCLILLSLNTTKIIKCKLATNLKLIAIYFFITIYIFNRNCKRINNKYFGSSPNIAIFIKQNHLIYFVNMHGLGLINLPKITNKSKKDHNVD